MPAEVGLRRFKHAGGRVAGHAGVGGRCEGGVLRMYRHIR
jgi:hypothetical protein